MLTHQPTGDHNQNSPYLISELRIGTITPGRKNNLTANLTTTCVTRSIFLVEVKPNLTAAPSMFWRPLGYRSHYKEKGDLLNLIVHVASQYYFKMSTNKKIMPILTLVLIQ